MGLWPGSYEVTVGPTTYAKIVALDGPIFNQEEVDERWRSALASVPPAERLYYRKFACPRIRQTWGFTRLLATGNNGV